MERKQFKSYTYNFPRPIGHYEATCIRMESGGLSGTWFIESLDQYGRIVDRRTAKDKAGAKQAATAMFDFLLATESC